MLERLVEIADRRTPLRRPLCVAHRGLDRLPRAAAALLERMLAAPPVIMEAFDR